MAYMVVHRLRKACYCYRVFGLILISSYSLFGVSHVLLVSVWVFQVLQYPPTCKKPFLLIGNSKLALCRNNVSYQESSCLTLCSCDMLQMHHNPNHDETVTENEQTND